MLRVLGHDAALLDGGLQAWPGATATEPSHRAPVTCPVRDWPDGAFVDIDGAATAGASPNAVLIDARGADRYRGETEPIDARPGHIPGAANVPFVDNFDADGFFADSTTLRARYESEGVADAGETVIYCGSGVSACTGAITMEHSGLGRPRVYVGSWSQWSHTDRPAETV